MDRHIPIVISEGDPFTRGFQLGRSQTEGVIQTIAAYMDIFAKMVGQRDHHAKMSIVA